MAENLYIKTLGEYFELYIELDGIYDFVEIKILPAKNIEMDTQDEIVFTTYTDPTLFFRDNLAVWFMLHSGNWEFTVQDYTYIITGIYDNNKRVEQERGIISFREA